MEPGAIVARFAESWLRIGSFDLIRSRGDRSLMRKLATYAAEHVFSGWASLPSRVPVDEVTDKSPEALNVTRDVDAETCEGPKDFNENRFARLYREIVRRNAQTVAYWQAYGFMNGVLNTDNTSIFGLSMDYGPFAFMDNFDPSYTPNHDDAMLRYSYRNQPTIIWWNLVRLGEDLGELLGAGGRVDEPEFIEKGVKEEDAEVLVKRAETIINRTGQEFRAVFLAKYKALMAARLGLKLIKEEDSDKLISELLDTLEALELDFHHAFRRLSSFEVKDLETQEQRREAARKFFHAEGMSGVGQTGESAQDRIAKWLETWKARVVEDWGESEDADQERKKAMKAVNPKFVPRSWILDELIERVEKKGERKVLGTIMDMSLRPLEESWGGDRQEEERWCGDVPKHRRAMQCSCSS